VSKSEKAEIERLKSWQFLHICVLRDYLHLEFQVSSFWFLSDLYWFLSDLYWFLSDLY
jgi:5'-3' exonuclease